MLRKQNDMLNGPIFSGIISYTIPIILTNILQLMFHSADMIVVGQFCGSLSLAAVGATSTLTTLMLNIFIGLSVGVGVSVAHGIGSREEENVHKTVHTALPVALISGILLTIIALITAEPLLRLMNTPETVLPLSVVYMQIYFCGTIFNLLNNFCASILRAAGDSRSPMVHLTIAGILNVILNILFVLVFHMNVAGVALATVLSQGYSAVMLIYILTRRTDACKLSLTKCRIYMGQFLKILRIGIPAGLESALFSVSNVVVASAVNSFGDVFLSGVSASNNISNFVYFLMNAFAQTTLNYVGQNYSARNYKRVNRIIGQCMICVIVSGITLGWLAYGFAEPLLSIYITDSQEAIKYGTIKLAFICIPYFLGGMLEVSSSSLRGIGASTTPMVLSIVGTCFVRIGWILTFFQWEQFHTPEWLYVIFPVSWFLTFVAQIIAFSYIYKRKIKLRTQNEAV